MLLIITLATSLWAEPTNQSAVAIEPWHIDF